METIRVATVVLHRFSSDDLQQAVRVEPSLQWAGARDRSQRGGPPAAWPLVLWKKQSLSGSYSLSLLSSDSGECVPGEQDPEPTLLSVSPSVPPPQPHLARVGSPAVLVGGVADSRQQWAWVVKSDPPGLNLSSAMRLVAAPYGCPFPHLWNGVITFTFQVLGSSDMLEDCLKAVTDSIMR